MIPQQRYQIFADRRYHSEYASLIGACVAARTEAAGREGVNFEVELGGRKVASYCLSAGKLAAWMA